MMNSLLLPEIKRLYEVLRQEEEKLSSEEKQERHMLLLKHCKHIVALSDIARKECLMALEEVAMKLPKSPAESFDRELLQWIIDCIEPEEIKTMVLMKYFSTEQSTIQAIKNIMSIYGILSIQAGKQPMEILRTIKNMLPDDVKER